ncbi:hypothetical protein NLG97_g3352 [Lecanicillium saksenae]|uniref:Uncharacterized protein n=1 Tax=Lecanicillium saksenae TaxID=468837 RepID=A0ACC1R1L0_9HYPO|nr:hypothetical protein NLG97_g3352 [Lecanicillium saksenae]
MPELDHVPSTFDPCVIPLGAAAPMLDFEPHLLTTMNRLSKPGSRYYSIADYHEKYKSGQLTPLQVARTILSLVNKPGSYDDAWADSHGMDHLVLEAAKASTERYAAGKPLGVMDGVPIGIKDDTDVKGYINHIGMKYNASAPCFTPKTESAWPVRMLQEAGAVIIGKNCMHELGSDTNGLNVAQGTPTNHCNNDYYPGGSSSGGGSAVSAGVVPLCIGTDAGGSIRLPASFGGVYGLKPSHHRTMRMASTMCVTGPIAASASDLTIAYRLMSQPNPACPTQGKFGLSIPPQPSSKRVMGIYRDWWNAADAPVKKLCDQAVAYFSEMHGYEVVDISIPHLCQAQLAHSIICSVEMAEAARRRASDWLSLCAPTNNLIMPVAANTSAADLIKFNALRTVVMQHLAFLFQKHPGLLIVTPTTPLTGWPRSAGDQAYGLSDLGITTRNMSYIFLANMTGTPSVTVPIGYTEPEQGKGKLPVSLLATGEWGSEEQLLAWARQAEEYLHDAYEDGRRRPETWADVLTLAKEGDVNA